MQEAGRRVVVAAKTTIYSSWSSTNSTRPLDRFVMASFDLFLVASHYALLGITSKIITFEGLTARLLNTQEFL